MEDLRSGIERLKQAKAHMREANGIMSDCISQLKEIGEENERLKDELSALQIQSDDSYMKLPLDADGVPIRIGDKANVDGEAMTVLGYRIHNVALLLIVEKMESNITFTDVRRFKYTPSDSWEKLEEDARKSSCDYASAPLDENGFTTCDGCRFQNGGPCHLEKDIDLIARAKKLAGIEGEAER